MAENRWELKLTDMQALAEKKEVTELLAVVQKTEQFGLTLTEGEVKDLVVCKRETLKREQRLDLNGDFLKELIMEFCDSQYLNQDNYLESLERLQDIFYEFKNESDDRLTDEELLHFMREQFEEVCMGDLDYLEGTCLDRYARAIRAGYRGYEGSEGYGEYSQFSEEERWSPEMYLSAVRELMWE